MKLREDAIQNILSVLLTDSNGKSINYGGLLIDNVFIELNKDLEFIGDKLFTAVVITIDCSRLKKHSHKLIKYYVNAIHYFNLSDLTVLTFLNNHAVNLDFLDDWQWKIKEKDIYCKFTNNSNEENNKI